MISFLDFVQKESPKIRSAMDDIFSDWQQTVHQHSPELLPMNQLLVDSASGGKLLRGLLIVLGYNMYSHSPKQDIYKIAAAYEILHTALLIHDDIIDKAQLRRGKPTVVDSLGGKHYGISQAICIGDIGLFLAQQTIVQSAFSDAIKVRMMSELSDVTLKTILGEMLDVRAALKKNKNQEEVITIAQLKTAHYTVVGPLQLGAMAADNFDKKQYLLRQNFGLDIGIAFQIKDDILGIFSDEKQLGKSVNIDIKEGKNSLLIHHALTHGTKDQKIFLKKYYGNAKITPRDIEHIQIIFKETGAYMYSEKMMQSYLEKGENALTLLTQDKKWQYILSGFIVFVINREK